MTTIVNTVVPVVAQRPIATSILAVVAATIVRVVQKGYVNRKFFRDLVCSLQDHICRTTVDDEYSQALRTLGYGATCLLWVI
jgi:hypothetical protein